MIAAAYYNEFDPYAAQWLRNLIAKNLIPAGDVDERSIVEVDPDDLRGYTQCHFFAGIGGWALAARAAGWPDDRELWTGSPPCQPFSVAGKGKAQDDDRHLWPHYFRLIRARRPAVAMGEQVAAAVGKAWLDGVHADLEGITYACWAVVVPACAVNAPHRRDRLWFVAERGGAVGDAICVRLEGLAGNDNDPRGWPQQDRSVAAAGRGGDVADGDGRRRERREDASGGYDPDRTTAGRRESASSVEFRGEGDVADTYGLAGGQGDPFAGGRTDGSGAGQVAGSRRAWDGAGWIIGHDGKARRVEPSIRLLAHGVSGRMAVVRPGFEADPTHPEALHWYSRIGALKGFGNAIVHQIAVEVIGAYMDVRPAANDNVRAGEVAA